MVLFGFRSVPSLYRIILFISCLPSFCCPFILPFYHFVALTVALLVLFFDLFVVFTVALFILFFDLFVVFTVALLIVFFDFFRVALLIVFFVVFRVALLIVKFSFSFDVSFLQFSGLSVLWLLTYF